MSASSRLLALSALVASTFLAGCGIGQLSAPIASGPTPAYPGASISGKVFGGLTPIVGATVKLYATTSVASPGAGNNYGYGQAGTLLNIADFQAPSGNTDSNGNFHFNAGTFLNACPAGQYAYITIAGGNTGANVANSNLLLVAPLGPCATAFDVTGTNYNGTFVFVNEVTTLATAYALGNFMTVTGSGASATVNISAPLNNNFSDGTNAWNGSAYAACTGTACNGSASFNAATGVETAQANGLQHAFQNAANLVNITTGQANAAITTGVTGATGTIPAAEINTLANAAQTCVNSAGTSTSTTFVTTQGADATHGQISTLTLPNATDTLSGTLTVTDSYRAPATITVPSGTTLSGLASLLSASTLGVAGDITVSATSTVLTVSNTHADFSAYIFFNSTGMSDTAANYATATTCGIFFNAAPTIDGTVPANTLQALMNIAKNPYSSTSNVSTLFGMQTPQGIAYGPNLSAAPADWTLNIVYTGAGISNPYYLALDANDVVYADNHGASKLTAITSNGAFQSGTTGFPLSDGTNTFTGSSGIAADSLGNVFVTNNSSATPGTYEFKNDGTYVAKLSHTTAINYAAWPAVTRRNDVWTSYLNNGVGNLDWWQCTGSPCTYTFASVVNNKNSYTNGAFTEVSAATGANNFGAIVDPSQNVWVAVEGNAAAGTSIGIMTNGFAATQSTYPAYDNSTSAGLGNYTHPKLLPTVSTCNTAPFSIALDSSNVGWFTTTTSVPSATVPTPGGGLCHIALTTTSGVASGTNSLSSLINVGLGIPEALAMDGNNVAWIPLFSYNVAATGYNNYGLAAYNTASGAMLPQPTNGFIGCYAGAGTTCGTGTTGTAVVNTGLAITNPRAVVIDSTGTLWTTNPGADSLVQTIGTAAPTWPLLSAAFFGVRPY